MAAAHVEADCFPDHPFVIPDYPFVIPDYPFVIPDYLSEAI